MYFKLLVLRWPHYVETRCQNKEYNVHEFCLREIRSLILQSIRGTRKRQIWKLL